MLPPSHHLKVAARQAPRRRRRDAEEDRNVFGGGAALHAVSWLKHYLQMVGRVPQPRHERVRDVVV